jgi:hypothetical protein
MWEPGRLTTLRATHDLLQGYIFFTFTNLGGRGTPKFGDGGQLTAEKSLILPGIKPQCPRTEQKLHA